MSSRRRAITLIIAGLVILIALVVVGISLPEISTVETTILSCANCLPFPVISGQNLPGEAFTLPADFRGDPVLVIVPFDEEQQQQAQTWLPPAREIVSEQPGFAYYDVAVFPDTAAAFRVVIRAGMNIAISDAELRAVTITVFLEDRDQFLGALDIADASTLQAFLIDGSGNVIWRGAGIFTEAQGKHLRAVLGT